MRPVSENFCPKCAAYLWSNGGKSHRCPPTWQVRLKEDGERWTETHAHSAEAAAEKFAEELDPGNDYFILQQGDRSEVVIEVMQDNKVVGFRITAESVPHYHAEELENQPR